MHSLGQSWTCYSPAFPSAVLVTVMHHHPAQVYLIKCNIFFMCVCRSDGTPRFWLVLIFHLVWEEVPLLFFSLSMPDLWTSGNCCARFLSSRRHTAITEAPAAACFSFCFSFGFRAFKLTEPSSQLLIEISVVRWLWIYTYLWKIIQKNLIKLLPRFPLCLA